MKLLLGSDDDRLFSLVRDGLERTDRETLIIENGDMNGSERVTVALPGGPERSCIRVNRKTVFASDITGVLMRWTSLASHPTGFSEDDRAFVLHERIAAWIAFFQQIDCPIVNNLDLSFWIGEPSQPLALMLSFASAAQWQVVHSPFVDIAVLRDRAESILPVYLVADSMFAARPIGPPIISSIRRRIHEIRIWQKKHGIMFCRLTLSWSPEPQLLSLSPNPDMNDEEPSVRERVAAKLVELIR